MGVSLNTNDPMWINQAEKLLKRQKENIKDFGKKNGKSKFDLFKAMHYCTLLYYFSGLTNESIDSNETI